MQHAQIVRRHYRFPVYILWRLLLAIVGGGTALILPALLFDTKAWIEQWPEALVKGILVLIIILFILLVRKLIIIPVEVSIDTNGISIRYQPDGGLFPSGNDQMLMWHEMASWKFKEEHASAHSWSPPEFVLKTSDGRKVKWLIADRDAFQPFLLDFDHHVSMFNARNTALPPIDNNLPKRRRAAKIVLALFLPASFFLLWFGIQDIQHPRTDFWDAVSLIALGILSLALCGWMVYVLRTVRE